MDNNKYDLAKILKFELKQRNNPTDLKAVNIGVVEQLSPLIVSISENKILLEENEELIISEWFRFRCNIDKTFKLSSGVPTDLNTSKTECDSASGVSEVHSFGGSPCQMPNAIANLVKYLWQNIGKIDLTKLPYNLDGKSHGDFIRDKIKWYYDKIR